MDSGHTLAFGTLLRRARRAAGLTQEEMAERAGVGVRTISDLERGVSHTPHTDTVARLAKALGVQGTDRGAFVAAAGRLRAPASLAQPGRDIPSVGTGNFLGAVPLGTLVARDDEVARIHAILDRVAGGTGHLLLLAGELGVGKTRLAQEVMAAALALGFAVGTGRCYQSEQETPYYAMLEALDGLVSSAPVAARGAIQRRRQDPRRLMSGGGAGGGPGGDSLEARPV